MKQYKKTDFFNELKRPRVDALASYYELAETMLEIECRGNEEYSPPTGFNKSGPVALWLDCLKTDEIIERAGLKNPLFKE